MTAEISSGPQPLNKKGKIQWLITVFIPIMVLLIPVNEVFTSSIRNFLAITIIFILVSAFELVDNFIAAIFLPAAYIISRVAAPAVAFGAWSSELPWVTLTSFLLVNVIEKTGLLKRAAFWIILRTGGTYNGVLYGFFGAGLILNLFLPGGIIVPLMAMAYGVCVALDLGKGSKAAAGIMIASAIGASYTCMSIYTPNFFAVVLNCAKAYVPTLDVTFVGFLLDNLIYLVFYMLCILVVSKMFKPEKLFQSKEYFKTTYQSFGKLSKDEKKAALVVLCLTAYLLTMGWHKLGMGWGFMIASCVMFVPGINLGEKKDIVNVNMGIALFCGSCLSIGVVAASLGIGEIVTEMVMPLLAGKSVVTLFSGIIAVTWVLNFIMTPAAIVAIFAGPLSQVVLNLGMDPLPFLYVLNSAGWQVLFPYEQVSMLILYSIGGGYLSMKHFIKWGLTASVVHLLFILCLAAPYWKLLGLL